APHLGRPAGRARRRYPLPGRHPPPVRLPPTTTDTPPAPWHHDETLGVHQPFDRSGISRVHYRPRTDRNPDAARDRVPTRTRTPRGYQLWLTTARSDAAAPSGT